MKKYLSAFFIFNFSFLISFAQPKYEFRGVWVATVDNIDWPSTKFLSTDSQRIEFIKLLDMHKQNGMNAIIAQVRPATDAFYPSQYEPWSEWLTGTQGKPPIPYYDPLEFMITETHKRGMEFHAWMNPYRAEFKIGGSSISPTHITKLHPDWFLPYGTVKIFDPGNKEVQQYVTNVVRDIVSRYDVDAIHFDDYFYPYRIAGKEFPDSVSYAKYGHGMNKEDWRRSNLDSIIFTLSKAIKQENKYCKFGISPFGVWRNIDKDPQGSNTKAGQTNYDDLYADILLWLKMGWIDYVAPQLYWEFGHKAAPYEILLDWWSKHTYGKQCYIGLGIYRAGSNESWKDPTQLPRQIQALRNTPNINGAIYFSSKSFNSNRNGWSDSLRNNYYHYPSIVPPISWIDSIIPTKIVKAEPPFVDFELTAVKDGVLFEGYISNYLSVKQYGFYLSKNQDSLKNSHLLILVPSSKHLVFTIPKELINFEYYPLEHMHHSVRMYIGITSISKTNNESEMSVLYYHAPVE